MLRNHITIKRKTVERMIETCLLGCGGVMPLPNRALTSLYVRYNGSAILIDCGEGTQTSLRRCEMKHSRIDAIMFTHLHADHISGIVGLLLTFGLEGRTEPLKIYGPIGVKAAVEAMRIIAPNLPFEIFYNELGAQDAIFNEIGLKITAFPLNHSVPCLGYKIELERAPKFDIEKARALNIPVKLWGILQAGKSADKYSPADVMGEPRRGISLLYATDTRPTETVAAYGKDTDLIILEGMYGDHELEDKAKEAGHMMMYEAAKLAADLGAKQLWLTHYSPQMTDPDIYADELKSIFPETKLGYDGLFDILKFEN
jgi:ribonuclease Z